MRRTLEIQEDKATTIVTIDPEVMSGTPVFTGTRVPVKAMFDWLETETLEEFLENFPSVRKEQAEALMDELIAEVVEQVRAERYGLADASKYRNFVQNLSTA